jgi:thymidylate kinase
VTAREDAMHARFLCVAGIDGAGKSSVLRRLKEHNPRIEIAEWKRFEPNLRIPTLDDRLSVTEMMARLDTHARSAALLYVASLQYDQVIRPALASGRIVIADSYWYKLLAREQVRGQVAAFLEPALNELPVPAHIYFLDTPPDVALARKSALSFAELDGDLASFVRFQRHVRARMRALFAGVPTTMLDGRRPVHELADAIAQLDPRLLGRSEVELAPMRRPALARQQGSLESSDP